MSIPTTIVVKGIPAWLRDMPAAMPAAYETIDISQKLLLELKQCAELSKEAYHSPVKTAKENNGLTQLAFLSKNDTQVYIWKRESEEEEKDKRVYVVFRGTKGLEDIVDDIDIRHKRFSAAKGVKVHAGFYRQWLDIAPLVDRELKALKGPFTLVCTGHSLGGALATLASLEYADKYKALECYTFGSPRVGNHNFCTAFEEKVPVHWRIVNEKDPVPTLPFGPRFYHVSPGLCLMEKGGVKAMSTDVPWYRRIFDPIAKFDLLKPGKEHQSSTYVAQVKKWLKYSNSSDGPLSQVSLRDNKV